MPINRIEVVERLAAAGCIAAEEEAEELLSNAPDPPTLEAWVGHREQGEPLAWIVGSTRFCGHSVRVDPGIFVPRHQSEKLAQIAAELLSDNGLAIDLCTGSGAVACHLMAERQTARVVGIDVDERAARCARSNGVRTLVGDLGSPLRSHSCDLITAVAPYVPSSQLRLLPADVQRYEPRLALDGGADGLALVRRMVLDAARVLKTGGWLVTELGAEQDQSLGPDLAASGFAIPQTWFDEDGELRGIAAQLVELPPSR